MRKIILGVMVAVALVAGGVVVGTSSHRIRAEAPADACALPGAAASTVVVDGFDAEQVSNAAAIINQGIAMGATYRDQVIAVMTAMGESSLHDIAYGDWETSGVTNPDGTPTSSIGLFQQQKWWGTVEQRMDPAQSAALFFARLLQLAGREGMSPTLVAHAIQVNADPYYYTQFWDAAVRLAAALTGATAQTTGRWVVPLAAPYVITDPFGDRVHPITGVYGMHTGDDMAAPYGTPVLAAADGTVSVVADQGSVSYGMYVVIDHGGGVETLYGHLSLQAVAEGQAVSAGQQIGDEGSTGASTGPHMHFEVRVDGSPTDPAAWMADHGTPLDGTAGSLAGSGSAQSFAGCSAL